MIKYKTRHNKQELLKQYLLEDKISGYKVLNLIFPEDFCCKDENWLVKNGWTQPLTFSKSKIQKVFKEICSQYSPKTSVQCISDFSRVMTKYLSDFRGLSISLDDISLIKPINDEFQQKIKNVCNVVEQHAFDDPQQKIIGLSACNNIFENNIKHTSFFKKASNSLSIMIKSGAKGKISNLQQLTTCIGQQIVNAEFPEPQTCFQKTDQSVKSTGFHFKFVYNRGYKQRAILFSVRWTRRID